MRAHGEIADAVAELVGDELVVRLREPLRGVARGQTLVLYRPDPRRRRGARLGGAKEVIPFGRNSIFLYLWVRVLRLDMTQVVTILFQNWSEVGAVD